MSDNSNYQTKFFIIILFIVSTTDTTHSWKYQTKCTHTSQSSSIQSSSSEQNENTYSIVDDFNHILVPEQRNVKRANKMTLKCPNSNDFLFIGLTQYGVSSIKHHKNSCKIKENDCLVTVDYLASQCNGFNSCDIQLDAQFLHTCKNLSDYLSIAYDCIPGSKRVDICSNEETFIIDSTFNDKSKTDLNDRFGSFYLTSPNYPWEYDSNLNNCSCSIEYVEIDGAVSVQSDEMNLVLKSFEFDLEEGENKRCNKDRLQIGSNNKDNIDLCGQYSDFKQFYASGETIKMNFTTDDIITRRGFLLEVAPVARTICPHGTTRFDETKCVKVFGNHYLTHNQASKACVRKGGEMLKVNDFVDNIKLSSFLEDSEIGSEIPIWADYESEGKKSETLSFLNLKKRRDVSKANKCVSRKSSFWTVESCFTKLPYICQFSAIDVRKPNKSVVPKNKLIRVSCGKLTSKFDTVKHTTTTSTLPTTTTTTISTMTTATKSQDKPVLLWSSLLDNFNKPGNNKKYFVHGITTTTTSTFVPGTIRHQKTPISQNLILIIAIVCGVSAVFIIVNIFCIWNYYNKKLNAFIEKSDPEASTYNRTSTLRSSNRRHHNQNQLVSNNRSTSTVDSYVKVLPYNNINETCLLNPASSNASNSPRPSSQSTERMENELKLDILRNFFNQNQRLENQLNFYETISNHRATNTNSNGTTTKNSSIDSLNSAFQLLLNQQLQREMIYETYADVSPAMSLNSQRPLISFLSSKDQITSNQ